MPKEYGIVVKIPVGSPAPAGYTFVRSTRQGDIYKKPSPAPVPQSAIDDLMSSFSRMGVSSSNVVVKASDDLANILSKMTIGGKRRTLRKKSKKTKKTKKSTRRKTHRKHR